ncbi:hypothetical protein HK099_003064 [Clydaea vesicula]|uniref:Uncharacterized protein n=1 Tax=Clydaea vesicula TaxID=447962 RepID=A0AAD5XWD3_9FUNG|nr:hypothetical protein HK099_003064 [Clydaea vesicula]
MTVIDFIITKNPIGWNSIVGCLFILFGFILLNLSDTPKHPVEAVIGEDEPLLR